MDERTGFLTAPVEVLLDDGSVHSGAFVYLDDDADHAREVTAEATNALESLRTGLARFVPITALPALGDAVDLDHAWPCATASRITHWRYLDSN